MAAFRSAYSPKEDVDLSSPLVGRKRGRIPRDYAAIPYGKLPGARRAEDSEVQLIPFDEWPDRIKEQEDTKTRLSDMLKQAGIQAMDQDGLSYCWVYAVTQDLQSKRRLAGEPLVLLVPESAGAFIKNFRDVGGWGGEALEFMADRGVASQKFWKRHSLSRSNDTPEMRANALLHRVTESFEFDPRNWQMLGSQLLARGGIDGGYNFMGHEVFVTDLLYLGGRVDSESSYGVRYLNSWKPSWGDNGYGVIKGSRWVMDDACSVRVSRASVN